MFNYWWDLLHLLKKVSYISNIHSLQTLSILPQIIYHNILIITTT